MIYFLASSTSSSESGAKTLSAPEILLGLNVASKHRWKKNFARFDGGVASMASWVTSIASREMSQLNDCCWVSLTLVRFVSCVGLALRQSRLSPKCLMLMWPSANGSSETKKMRTTRSIKWKRAKILKLLVTALSSMTFFTQGPNTIRRSIKISKIKALKYA